MLRKINRVADQIKVQGATPPPRGAATGLGSHETRAGGAGMPRRVRWNGARGPGEPREQQLGGRRTPWVFSTTTRNARTGTVGSAWSVRATPTRGACEAFRNGTSVADCDPAAFTAGQPRTARFAKPRGPRRPASTRAAGGIPRTHSSGAVLHEQEGGRPRRRARGRRTIKKHPWTTPPRVRASLTEGAFGGPQHEHRRGQP